MRFIAYYESPIGLLEIEATQQFLSSIKFVENKKAENQSSYILDKTIKQLEEYFNGTRLDFDIELSLNGTEFQKKVWSSLQNIAYGDTVTYKDIAEEVGSPKAFRAVGNSNNKNKIPIIIPCHRVVGSNKKLVGYAGGLWRKQWLIDHEKRK